MEYYGMLGSPKLLAPFGPRPKVDKSEQSHAITNQKPQPTRGMNQLEAILYRPMLVVPSCKALQELSEAQHKKTGFWLVEV